MSMLALWTLRRHYVDTTLGMPRDADADTTWRCHYADTTWSWHYVTLTMRDADTTTWRWHDVTLTLHDAVADTTPIIRWHHANATLTPRWRHADVVFTADIPAASAAPVVFTRCITTRSAHVHGADDSGKQTGGGVTGTVPYWGGGRTGRGAERRQTNEERVYLYEVTTRLAQGFHGWSGLGTCGQG